MKKQTLVLATAMTIATTMPAFAGCTLPNAPAIPDGATASKEEMMAAVKEFKQVFQPAIKATQDCIAREEAAVGDVATDEQKAQWNAIHNAAYEMEVAGAEKIRWAIQAFNAANK